MPRQWVSMVSRVPGRLAQCVDDQMVILSLVDDNPIALDAIGRRVWDLLETPCQVGDLCVQLSQESAANREQIAAVVLSLLEELADARLLLTTDAELEPTPAQQLCLACGLCCDGTLYPWARLDPTDSDEALAAIGLTPELDGDQRRFAQPCCLHRGAACTVYQSRQPRVCQRFACRLLQQLAQDGLPNEGPPPVGPASLTAQGVVARARQHVVEVRAQLGGSGEPCSLAAAYQGWAAATPPGLQRATIELNYAALQWRLDRDFRPQPVVSMAAD